MVHQYFNPANAETFNALASKMDNKFDLYYFGVHGLGCISRSILALTGANFKTNAPPGETWKTQYKPQTPFGVMPILRETSADGNLTHMVAESDAIERYLSRKFGLLGQTSHEELILSQFVASDTTLLNQLFQQYFTIDDNPELKAKNREKLLKGPVNDWIRIHEKHLSENPKAVVEGKEEHGNGHYVGDKFSLADLKTVYLIDILQGLTGEDLISKEKTPAIYKVKETVEAVPSVQAWKATEDFKQIAELNRMVLGF